MRDPNLTALIFKRGQIEYGPEYVRSIISDMRRVGYNLLEIGIAPVTLWPQQRMLEGLYVREDGIAALIEQLSISQGMFRALAILIQINFALISQSAQLLIIDDIGEGLDFERSKNLISVIVEKTKGSDVQVIMSTNDRLVMNAVDLKQWIVLERIENAVIPTSIANRPDLFNSFKYTGLSNFDFFAQDYVSGAK